MKRAILLLIAFSFIGQVFATMIPLAPVDPVQADHLPRCPEGTFPCPPEIEVRLSDPSITDANITWQRAATLSTSPSDGFEVNSGTLVFDDGGGDPHYHSQGLLIAAAEATSLGGPCDFGDRNTIVFAMDGVSNVATTNLCESQSGGVVKLEFTAQEDRDTGTAEIVIDDINGVLDLINASGMRNCTLQNTTTGDTFDCLDQFADDKLIVNGLFLTFIDLPPGDYVFTMSYEEVCESNAFSCGSIEEQTEFSEASVEFTVEAGATVRSALEVAATQEFNGENDGEVPPGRPERELPCDDGSLNNPLEWIICPFVNGLFLAIDVVYKNMFLPLLAVDPLDDTVEPGSPTGTLFGVWNNFRIIANVLFIIAFLAAIFGQALSGFQAFSAYDIRKIIPRLVIGVIGIQLSWFFVAFMIDVFNILGAGIRSLMLAPVEGLNLDLVFDLDSAWEELAVILGIAGVAVVAVWVGGILMGLPLVLFPILVGLVLAFMTVLARRVLILILIVTAPIAFVAWILPNTASIFRKWWEYFWKALIVYPLIIMLISAGELSAKIMWSANASESGTQAGAAGTLIAMIALFAPYFLIPLVFRFAGGILAETANGIDRRGKSMNQRLFGTPHDENSWRGRRRTKQVTTRARRKSRIGNRAQDMAGSSNRAVRGTGRALAYLNARAGGGSAGISAEQLQQARKWGSELTGSSRDEIIYAHLGDYNPLSGNRLSQEAIDQADRGDLARTQFALEYAIGKANNEKIDVHQVYSRFMHGHYGAEEMRNYSGNMRGQREKERAFKIAADRFQGEFGDYKYRDPTTLELTRDPEELSRFATEVVNRKSDGRTLGTERNSFWDGVGEMSGTARQIYEDAGGRFHNGRFDSSDFDPARLGGGEPNSREGLAQRKLLREMTRVRDGARDTPTSGAPATSNDAKSRAVRTLGWLDDPRLRGL